MDDQYAAFMAELSGLSADQPSTTPQPKEEVDPLDAFMLNLKDDKKSKKRGTKRKGTRVDLDEEEDPMDGFVDQLNRKKKSMGLAGKAFVLPRGAKSREDANYDSDEEVYATARAIEKSEAKQLVFDMNDNVILKKDKKMELVGSVNHDQVEYEPFEKFFYREHPEVFGMSERQKKLVLRDLDIRTKGYDPPNPCTSFAHFGLGEETMKEIRKKEFERPTAIQCMAVPCALSGRDVIGIAKTGSGKTAAYIWPMLVHIMDQRHLEPGEGPIALAVSPTRELCQQIYDETRRYARHYKIRVCPVYGGMNMYEQVQGLKKGTEIVIATPGRIMDVLRKNATNLRRVTYIVLDEADRMFSMGFEEQLRAVVNRTRPDRQTLMFSATFPLRIEALARDICDKPIRVNVGLIGAANKDIRQVVDVLSSDDDKFGWLKTHLWKFMEVGPVLIFVSQIVQSEALRRKLHSLGVNVGVIHGDCSQATRKEMLQKFKDKKIAVLVATDVAARGLDIKGLKTVVNYDCARDIDTHTHRIGRTGRAGESGIAYTLLAPLELDFRMAPLIMKNMHDAGQLISPVLAQFSEGKVPSKTYSYAAQSQLASIETGANSNSSSTTHTSAAAAIAAGEAGHRGEGEFLGTSKVLNKSNFVPAPPPDASINRSGSSSFHPKMTKDEEIRHLYPDQYPLPPASQGKTMRAHRAKARFGKRGKKGLGLNTSFVAGGRIAAKKSFSNSFVAAKGSHVLSGNLFMNMQARKRTPSVQQSPQAPKPVPERKKKRKSRWGK